MAKQVKYLLYRINKTPWNKKYINNEKIRPEDETKQELKHRQRQNKSRRGKEDMSKEEKYQSKIKNLD